MIEKVRVLNSFGVDKTFTFSDIFNGIKVQNITGLGPVAAEFNTTKNSSRVGVNRSSSSVGARHIVFTFGLSDTKEKTVEEYREDLYDIFPTDEDVTLRFTTGLGLRQIVGRVESVEPDLFSKDPQVQVSVMCEYPYFYALLANENKATLLAMAPSSVLYQGKVRNGMTFDVLVTSTDTSTKSGEIVLTQLMPDMAPRQIVIKDDRLIELTGNKLLPGDRIVIVTVKGHKAANLIRGNSSYNIIGALRNTDGLFLLEDEWPEFFVNKESIFAYTSTAYTAGQLNVAVTWDVVIKGL